MILEANLKKSILALCALTLAAGLSACGGGTSTHTISGVVTGLEHPGLVLENNGEKLTIAPAGYRDLKDEKGVVIGKVPNDVTYAFRNEVDYGDPYNVTVASPPQHQECVQAGGTTDTAGRLSVINAVIQCALVSNTIGGTVEGLDSGTLTLVNGSAGGTEVVPANATEFEFERRVTYGQTYGVTVLEAPAHLTCTVTNGAGEMGDKKVVNIAVVCRPKA